MQVILINANTGVVEVIRGLGLNHEFSKKFYELIEYQKNHPISRSDYAARINQFYLQYPDTQLMVDACQNFN